MKEKNTGMRNVTNTLTYENKNQRKQKEMKWNRRNECVRIIFDRAKFTAVQEKSYVLSGDQEGESNVFGVFIEIHRAQKVIDSLLCRKV